MPAPQPTAAEPARQDPFRWSRADIATALDDFSDPDPPSQRASAQQLGIPHATFNYWTAPLLPLPRTTPWTPSSAPPRASWSSAASSWPPSVVFQQHGACGIRLVGDVPATDANWTVSSPARAERLHPLAAHLESDLVAFRDSEQPALAQQMKPRTITVVADEHFHGGKPCLVAIEPVSDFILVECYRDRRDADTWKEAIREGTRGHARRGRPDDQRPGARPGLLCRERPSGGPQPRPVPRPTRPAQAAAAAADSTHPAGGEGLGEGQPSTASELDTPLRRAPVRGRSGWP